MIGYCKTCGREWTGHSEAHCASCCAHFTSDDAFDAHLTHPGSDEDYYDPATLTRRDGSPRFKLVARKHGSAWMLNKPGRPPKETVLRDRRARSDSTNGTPRVPLEGESDSEVSGVPV